MTHNHYKFAAQIEKNKNVLCPHPIFILFFSREAQLEQAVTSIALSGEGQQFFVGTEAAQMYGFCCKDFRPELISSSHHSPVKDVAICL